MVECGHLLGISRYSTDPHSEDARAKPYARRCKEIKPVVKGCE